MELKKSFFSMIIFNSFSFNLLFCFSFCNNLIVLSIPSAHIFDKIEVKSDMLSTFCFNSKKTFVILLSYNNLIIFEILEQQSVVKTSFDFIVNKTLLNKYIT